MTPSVSSLRILENVKDVLIHRIDEYDGKETVLIDHQKYELDQIKIILKSTDSNDEKIRQMERFVELRGLKGVYTF